MANDSTISFNSFTKHLIRVASSAKLVNEIFDVFVVIRFHEEKFVFVLSYKYVLSLLTLKKCGQRNVLYLHKTNNRLRNY